MPTQSKPRDCQCAECGKPYQSAKRQSRFCSTLCRKSFNNRRAMRGAELYDLFMATRYERESAVSKGVWTNMCKLAASWKQEDDRERAGRHSWGDWKAWLRANAWLHAVVIIQGRVASAAQSATADKPGHFWK